MMGYGECVGEKRCRVIKGRCKDHQVVRDRASRVGASGKKGIGLWAGWN